VARGNWALSPGRGRRNSQEFPGGCPPGTPGHWEDHLQGKNKNTTENGTNVLDHVEKSIQRGLQFC